MTADEIRALEIEVETALGWTLAEPGYETPEHSIAPLWRHTDGKERVGGPRRYITDPAATAEVKREVSRREWDLNISWVFDGESRYISVEVYTDTAESINTFTETPDDHDGDPIRAEATALVRAFLQACRATGATEGEGRKEGESGE